MYFVLKINLIMIQMIVSVLLIRVKSLIDQTIIKSMNQSIVQSEHQKTVRNVLMTLCDKLNVT